MFKKFVYILFFFLFIGVKAQYSTEIEGDTIEYIYYDDFENWSTSDVSTTLNLADKRPMRITTMIDNSIVDIGGDYNNVWKSNIAYGENYGIVYEINLGEAYDELYFDYDIYADPLFDGESIGGKNSGKMTFGFRGGGSTLTAGGWVLDSSASGNGWNAHGIWGSGDPNTIRGYSYQQDNKGPFYQLFDMSTIYNYTVPVGIWDHTTIRVKKNTPGQRDGIFEYYVNGELLGKNDTCLFSSWAQVNENGENIALRQDITTLMITYFFGGGGIEYASTRDNYIYFDNFCVSHYLDGAENYTTESRDLSDVIPEISHSGELYKPFDEIMYDTVFTTYADTIMPSYKGGIMPPFSREEIEVRIITDTANCKLTFLRFDDGYSGYVNPSFGWPQSNSVNVWFYSDTGSSKIELYHFGHASDGGLNDPPPSISSPYTITDSLITIVYTTGFNYSEGWMLVYDAEKEGEYEPPDPPDYESCTPYYNSSTSEDTVIYVNFTHSTLIPTLNPEWNNLSDKSFGVPIELDDTAGNTTGVKLTHINVGTTVDIDIAGPTGGIYPDTVMKGMWRSYSNPAKIELSGLPVDDSLIVTVYGAHTNNYQTTNYIVNSQQKSINVYNNLTTTQTWNFINDSSTKGITWDHIWDGTGQLNAMILRYKGSLSTSWDTVSNDTALVDDWYIRCGVIPTADSLYNFDSTRYVGYKVYVTDSITGIVVHNKQNAIGVLSVWVTSYDSLKVGELETSNVGSWAYDTIEIDPTILSGYKNIYLVVEEGDSIITIDTLFFLSDYTITYDSTEGCDTLTLYNEVDYLSECEMDIVSGDTAIWFANGGSYFIIHNVDFDECVPNRVALYLIAVSSYLYEFTVTLDSLNGTEILSYTPSSTGDLYTFEWQSFGLSQKPTGVHDVYWKVEDDALSPGYLSKSYFYYSDVETFLESIKQDFFLEGVEQKKHFVIP